MPEGPKLPAIQFYTGDWMKAADVAMCSPATRGIWFDAICAMHDSDRSGTLAGTPDQLIRVLRCSLAELHAAIAELKATGAADVTERNSVVTLINRRMQRQHRERLATRERVRKHRGNGNETGGLPPASSSSSISSSPSGNTNPPNPPRGGRVDKPPPNDPPARKESPVPPPGFVRFWSSYPPGTRKVDKPEALKIWKRRNLEPIADRVIQALEQFKGSHDWTKEGGRYAPGPVPWLNKSPWETDPADLAPANGNGHATGSIWDDFTPPTPEQIRVAHED